TVLDITTARHPCGTTSPKHRRKVWHRRTARLKWGEATPSADVAQLVERNLAKVEVASSSLVVRSVKALIGSPARAFAMSAAAPIAHRCHRGGVTVAGGGLGRCHQRVPVSRSYASMYLARVCSTTRSGSGGGGCSLARSQPDSGDVSQSRTYCLSNDGWG